jgi:excisionase family DNA binding protein
VTDIEQQIRDIVRDELAKQRPAANDADHLTVADYARRYSISERTVRDAVRDGRLEHVRIGRAVRVPASAKIERRAPDAATSRARLKLLGGTVR